MHYLLQLMADGWHCILTEHGPGPVQWASGAMSQTCHYCPVSIPRAGFWKKSWKKGVWEMRGGWCVKKEKEGCNAGMLMWSIGWHVMLRVQCTLCLAPSRQHSHQLVAHGMALDVPCSLGSQLFGHPVMWSIQRERWTCGQFDSHLPEASYNKKGMI